MGTFYKLPGNDPFNLLVRVYVVRVGRNTRCFYFVCICKFFCRQKFSILVYQAMCLLFVVFPFSVLICIQWTPTERFATIINFCA